MSDETGERGGLRVPVEADLAALAAEDQPEPQPSDLGPQPAIDETILRSGDPWER